MRRTLVTAVAIFAVWTPSRLNAEQMYLVTSTGFGRPTLLAGFDSETPEIMTSHVEITGLEGLESFGGIDFRPADGRLYGVTNRNHLYTIDVETGEATLIATLEIVESAAIGVDFDPVDGRLRVVSRTGRSWRIDVDTGETSEDAALAYAKGDPSFGRVPYLTGAAVTKGFAAAPWSVFYAIDSDRDTLVTEHPCEAGLLFTVGRLGINPPGISVDGEAFDVSSATGTAYLSSGPREPPRRTLYTVDLMTGAPTAVGRFGIDRPIAGIAVAPPPKDRAPRPDRTQ